MHPFANDLKSQSWPSCARTIDRISEITMKVNDILKTLATKNVTLVDFKLEFGTI